MFSPAFVVDENLVSILESLGSSHRKITLSTLEAINIPQGSRQNFIERVLDSEITQSLKTGILNISNKTSYNEASLPPKFTKLAHYVKNENWETENICRNDAFIQYCLTLFFEGSMSGMTIDDIVSSKRGNKEITDNTSWYWTVF